MWSSYLPLKNQLLDQKMDACEVGGGGGGGVEKRAKAGSQKTKKVPVDLLAFSKWRLSFASCSLRGGG